MTSRTPAPSAAGARCAYLVSQYPALSHVFIESEVAALRALGWHVSTFSVRRALLPDHPETAQTPALQAGGPREVLVALSRLLRRSPRALAVGFGAALRHGRGRSLRQRLWQFFYLAEALVLQRAMADAHLRHVHVHFANNAADIARLVTRIGRAVDGGRSWTWSLAVHGPTELDNAVAYDLAAKASAADLVTCITDYARSQVMRHLPPEDWSRLHVVRMGVADHPANRDAAGVEEGDGPGRPPFRVLFVGRLVPEKGPHVLLDAVDQLARAGAADRRVEVVVVGAGPLAASLHRRARTIDRRVSVTLLGGLPHTEVLRWYSWAHVFCLPSFAEGLPVVLMEALAHGLPVVTTPIAGIPELVVDQRTGLLVPPGRADSLAAALQRTADDPDAAREMGGRGRAAVRSRHDALANGIILAGLIGQTTSGDE